MPLTRHRPLAGGPTQSVAIYVIKFLLKVVFKRTSSGGMGKLLRPEPRQKRRSNDWRADTYSHASKSSPTLEYSFSFQSFRASKNFNLDESAIPVITTFRLYSWGFPPRSAWALACWRLGELVETSRRSNSWSLQLTGPSGSECKMKIWSGCTGFGELSACGLKPASPIRLNLRLVDSSCRPIQSLWSCRSHPAARVVCALHWSESSTLVPNIY